MIETNETKISEWVENLLIKNNLPSNCTFKQLYQIKNKNLVITGSNMNTRTVFYFNYILFSLVLFSRALTI